MPPIDSTELEVRKLVVTIRDLVRQSRNGWVYWTQVARHQTGSTEYADVLVALASLPQWKHLFAMTGGVVKLTAEGLTFSAASVPQPVNEIQKIAKAVIHYAARLHDISAPR